MRTKLTKITLAAGIALAMAFTLNACGSDSDDPVPPNNGINGVENAEWYKYIKEGAKYYNPGNERCQNGVLERKCSTVDGDKWYNPLTHIFCDGKGRIIEIGEWKTCCDERELTLYGSCISIAIEGKCPTPNGDMILYDNNTHYCDVIYDPMTNEFTYEVKAKELCGNKYYEPSQYVVCKDEIVGEMCGGIPSFYEGDWFNPETHYCFYDSYPPTVKPIERCGNRYVSDDFERCNNGVFEIKCPDHATNEPNFYNPITHYCDGTGKAKNKLRCGD
jgi:hypothetical protein